MPSNPVDQLLAVMFEADTLVRVDLADAIVSAGWRPPPRVIETASVLRDESHGTVIRFRDGTVAAVDTAGGHWPGRVMTLENPVDYWHLTDGDMELFPALVLWEPEEADHV